MPRPLPRPAGDDDRVRPQRARPDRRQLHRVRPDHAAPGDRPDARPARRHRQGRHDAPRRLLRRARSRAARSPRPTASRSSASATATATSSTRTTGPGFEAAGLRVQRHVARPAAGRVHRARRPSVLGRHAGPPRVQEPARPAAPAVPRAGRRARSKLPRPSAGSTRLPHAGRRAGAERAPAPTHGGFRRLGEPRGPPGPHLARRRRRLRGARRLPLPARHRPLAGRGRRRAAACSTPRATRRWCSCASTARPTNELIVEIPAGMRDVARRADRGTGRRELVEEAGLAAGSSSC